jgi:hypothetical protein
VLENYESTGRVVWFPLPERDMTKYSITDELAAMARDRYQADWIIYADVDEFVCTHGKSLRGVLAESDNDGVTLLDIPRRTMTGPLIPSGRRATEILTLRIDRTVVPTAEQTISWDFPVPFVFQEVGGHIAIRASAIGEFGHGFHVAAPTWGKSATSDLYILHYAIRGYEELQQKATPKKWIADNPHLPPGWGGTAALNPARKDGRLREITNGNSPRRAANELVEDGTARLIRRCGVLAGRQLRPAPGIRYWSGWPSRSFEIMPLDEARHHDAGRALIAAEAALCGRGSAIPVRIDSSRVYSNFGPLAVELRNGWQRISGLPGTGLRPPLTAAGACAALTACASGTLCVIPA